MGTKGLRRRVRRAQRELAELLSGPQRDQKLTHQQLARRVGYDRSAVSRALSGRRASLPLTEQLASAVNANQREAQRLWQDIADLRKQIRKARRAAHTPASDYLPPRHMSSHADLIASLTALLEKTRTSRREIARRSGWSAAMVSSVLRGERGLSLDLMDDILSACGVPRPVTLLWMDYWWRLGWPDWCARRRRRWRGFKRRWYAERVDAS